MVLHLCIPARTFGDFWYPLPSYQPTYAWTLQTFGDWLPQSGSGVVTSPIGGRRLQIWVWTIPAIRGWMVYLAHQCVTIKWWAHLQLLQHTSKSPLHCCWITWVTCICVSVDTYDSTTIRRHCVPFMNKRNTSWLAQTQNMFVQSHELSLFLVNLCMLVTGTKWGAT